MHQGKQEKKGAAVDFLGHCRDQVFSELSRRREWEESEKTGSHLTEMCHFLHLVAFNFRRKKIFTLHGAEWLIDLGDSYG
jgi:hypothetical protein